MPTRGSTEEEATGSSSKPIVKVACEECGEKPWNYRCPGCSIRTCSLPCVKSHKARTSCTGQKTRTQFVPLSQFNDDIVISDFNFLEDALRVAESARRMRNGAGGCLKTRALGMLRKAAFKRRTRLMFLPPGMSKREKNQTRFNRRTNSILWTIEWRFSSTGVVLTDHCVDEQSNLRSVMAKHLQPTPWNNKLRPFCDLGVDRLNFFLRKNFKDPKSSFLKLNQAAPLGLQISGATIVEYPVILVYLPTQRPVFHVEVFNWSPPCAVEEVVDHAGRFYREEKIEDDEEPGGTKVVDLCESETTSQALEAVPLAGEEDGSAAMVLPAVVGGGEPFDRCFDLEGELMKDDYDLLGEMNPDDFLCLDQDFDDGMLELEEGEIPDLP